MLLLVVLASCGCAGPARAPAGAEERLLDRADATKRRYWDAQRAQAPHPLSP
jgi:hypothetical protein